MLLPFQATKVDSSTASKFIHVKTLAFREKQNKSILMYSKVKICIDISYNYNSYCAYDYRSTQSWKSFLWTSCEKIAHIFNVTKKMVSGSLHLDQKAQITVKTGSVALSVNRSSLICLRQLKTTVIRL